MTTPVHYRHESGAYVRLAHASGAGPYKGMFVGGFADGTAADFVADFGFVTSGLTVRRSFHDPTDFPTTYATSKAGDDWTHGLLSLQSLKPPGNDVAGMTNGAYDTQLADYAATCPTDRPFWLTIYHEPEDNISGPTFANMHKHCYDVVKAANPAIRYGYIALDSYWRPGALATEDPSDWDVTGFADWLGADSYGEKDPTVETDVGREVDPNFQRWLNVYSGPTGLPLVIAEYAYKAADTLLQQRADLIAADHAYLASLEQFDVWCYWHSMVGTNAQPYGWRLDDAAGQAAWSAVADAGRRP